MIDNSIMINADLEAEINGTRPQMITDKQASGIMSTRPKDVTSD